MVKDRLSGKPAIIIMIVAALLVGAGTSEWFNSVYKSRSKERFIQPLPDYSIIAVLPFVNMSGDAQQEYFADAITYSLFTDLSKIHEKFVLAGNIICTRVKGNVK